jgi:hypothetical protein
MLPPDDPYYLEGPLLGLDHLRPDGGRDGKSRPAGGGVGVGSRPERTWGSRSAWKRVRFRNFN